MRVDGPSPTSRHGAPAAATILSYDGTPLAVRVRGDAAAEPLLLIAGQSLSGAAWDPAVPALAARHRVVTFDHRGTGGSPTVFPGAPEQWTTRDAARDAVAVLDGLGIGSAHVYGHSMGGRVAQWVAIDAPDRVGGLVLGGTTGGDRLGVPRDEAVTRAMASGDADALGPLFFTDAWLARHPEDAGLPARAHALTARRAHYAASQGHDAWDELGRITAPTLVMHARDDEISPAGNALLLVGAVARAELLLLPSGRHVYYAGDDASSDAVVAFLSRHPLAGHP